MFAAWLAGRESEATSQDQPRQVEDTGQENGYGEPQIHAEQTEEKGEYGAQSGGSNESTGSEIDIAATGESLGDSPEKAPLKDKSEKLPYELPTGKFWLHDDRTEEDANNRLLYIKPFTCHMWAQLTYDMHIQ